MNTIDNLFSGWQFDKPVDKNSSIECPECKQVSKLIYWTEVDVYCETCGDHSGLACPLCDEATDYVWAKPFKVVETE